MTRRTRTSEAAVPPCDGDTATGYGEALFYARGAATGGSDALSCDGDATLAPAAAGEGATAPTAQPLPAGLFVEQPMAEDDLIRWTTEEERTAAAAFGAGRRREWLGWRALVRRELGVDVQIGYTAVGAPVVTNRNVHIGVSHCANRIAVCIFDRPCAVDIEPETRNFRRAAPRFLAPEEAALSADELLPGIVWCAKEALYKYAGRSELDLLRDIRIEGIEPIERGESVEEDERVGAIGPIGQGGRVQRGERGEQGERERDKPIGPVGQVEQAERNERDGQVGQVGQVERGDPIGPVEQVEQAERNERDGQVGQVERGNPIGPVGPVGPVGQVGRGERGFCQLIGRIAGGAPLHLTLLRREGYLIVFIR